jgi:hypothetical protein
LNTVVLKKTMFYLTESAVPLSYKYQCVNATKEILAPYYENHKIGKNIKL